MQLYKENLWCILLIFFPWRQHIFCNAVWFYEVFYGLMQWSLNKMAHILQTLYINTCLKKKMLTFWFKFHWGLFCKVQLTGSEHWFMWQQATTLPEPMLTHWGRVRHICVSKLTIICSDNVLSPDQCQAIIWTNAGILLIGPIGTNFSEILIEIYTFSFKKMRLKVSSAKRRPFCLGLNVLN